MPQKARLDVLDAERLHQQGIVVEIDLPDLTDNSPPASTRLSCVPNSPFASRTAIADQFRFRSHCTRTICSVV